MGAFDDREQKDAAVKMVGELDAEIADLKSLDEGRQSRIRELLLEVDRLRAEKDSPHADAKYWGELQEARAEVRRLAAQVAELRTRLGASQRLGLAAVFLADAIGEDGVAAEKLAYDEALTAPFRAELQDARADLAERSRAFEDAAKVANAEISRRMQIEAERDAALKRVETLIYHLDHWESKQHATVGIAFIRNHFRKAT